MAEHTPTPTPDLAAAKAAFADRVFRDLLGAVSIVGVTLGENLGLYAALERDGAATSTELAERAGIAERYAREWLEQQAADGILALVEASSDPLHRRYELPEAHRDVLANREDLDFMAPFARLLMAGAAKLPEIAQAFRTGGGVGWDEYGPDMRESQGDANRTLFLQGLREYLEQLPDVHERLVASDRPARIAEVGSGMGWAAIGLAIAYPHVTVDGYDLDVPAVERARQHAHEASVADRVRFHAEDGAEAGGQYDLVLALECIHLLPDPGSVLASMRAMMAPGGACIVMDERVGEEFSAPGEDVERLMYGYSLLVCLPDGLSHPASVGTGTVMRPPILQGYAEQAGFAGIETLDALDHPFFRFYRLQP